MADEKKAQDPSAAGKVAGEALEHLNRAIALCNDYRQENTRLWAVLQMVAKMAREGCALQSIAELAERALKDRKENAP